MLHTKGCVAQIHSGSAQTSDSSRGIRELLEDLHVGGPHVIMIIPKSSHLQAGASIC